MILVLMDDGVLKIYESLTAAELDVEGLDAPEVFRAIFDSDGAPYRIEWLVPNSLSRTIIGIGSATSGSYRLVAAGPPDPQAFSRLLMSVEYVDPPSRTQEILELRRRHSHAV